MKQAFHHPFFIRLRHWEYWNKGVVYAPLYCYWLWLALKARAIFFLTAANPGIKNGGFIMERKSEVYQILPQGCYPATCCFLPKTPIEEILQSIEKAGIDFPLIAKPDIGERGLAVKKIEDEAALETYAMRIPIPFLVQAYVPYENEVGIFYYRFPNAAKGHISGIVNKEPVAVIGDGVQTVAQLAQANPRYLLQWKQIAVLQKAHLTRVLAQGERLVLVPYGNHSRGSKFTDESLKATPALVAVIDDLCQKIPGFYYGRLDVRFKDWASLERGEHFSIIELNGSGSEPTHIYDPKHSIFFAWKEVLRHWHVLHRISRANHRNGTPYISLGDCVAEIRRFNKIDAQLSAQVW